MKREPNYFGCLIASLFLGLCAGVAMGAGVLVYRILT